MNYDDDVRLRVEVPKKSTVYYLGRFFCVRFHDTITR